MSYDESCRDRQENEVEVLKSIFGDELNDLRKSKNKKKWQPGEIIITLSPQKGMSGPVKVYAQVDLHISCGKNYPDDVPALELKNSRGLSNEQVATLLSELQKLAVELKGEVMIFELAQHVQKYLHEHNKPGFSSFYDEMVSRHQERIQCEMQEKQLKEDKERQVLQDEIQRRQEALKAELRNCREATKLPSDADAISSSVSQVPTIERTRTFSKRRCVSTSESSDGLLCEHKGTKVLVFDNGRGERQVHRGKCLGHSEKGSVVYAGVDMMTGELLAITEWTLRCIGVREFAESQELMDIQQSLKQVAIFEQELNHLQKLHHPNLVHYLNMKYLQENNNLVIHVLQEFVVGTTCSFFLVENIPVDIDILRHLATGILSALQYLHENNVVHKDLRDSSIYIDRTGTVKLSDYSLNKRLSDIYQFNCIAKADHDHPVNHGRSGKKADIYRFGILLLSLLKGAAVTEGEIDLGIILQPQLKDFISKCLSIKEGMRWTAEQLQQHSFIRTPIDRGLTPPKFHRNVEQKICDLEERDAEIDMHFYLPAFGGQSRIQNEFEVLKWLGKGAFGDVLKVRNKLDGGIYAIKRIQLNPKNKLLNRKITREVKLLSRMNHENVVRYYNSWIESATVDASMRPGRSATPTISSVKSIVARRNEAEDINRLKNKDIEMLAPSLRDVEWNVSYESRTSAVLSADSEDNTDASSDSDSDDDCTFLMRTFLQDDSSDSIEFEKNDVSETTESSDILENNVQPNVDENHDNAEAAAAKEIQFMYIQMEFCEKSTLRTAIDNGLYEDEERVWRLFREIVEGLAHIHQQGMIHRDLKPVNIFLDSNDHVKIGDFGLATTNILSTLGLTVDADKECQLVEKGASFDADELGSLTGQVGTALYVAPELSAKAVKAIYNQKVDIYSLGVIFFEMCYKPLTTGMERVKILLNLRTKEIIFPPEVTETNMPHQVHILRWLLNHDPSQRPTAQELLGSEYLPSLQLEETELQEMVRHTLSNSQSKGYKYLVNCCFMQEVTPAEDITYDMSLSVREMSNRPLQKTRFLHKNIKEKVERVFKRHGGVDLTTPLLMPKSGQVYSATDSNVKLMTSTGSIVSLPHDLRVPFARYVVWNNISYIKRYAIERVFREKKVRGFHPRELYECAFDIVSSVANNLMAEAELISIAWEIFSEIPQLRERNFTVRLNHTHLLEAVLAYCGVEREKYQDIYSILSDARNGKFSKFQVQTRLISLCLTDQAMETLFNLFETESTVTRISSILRTITKRKGEAAGLAKEGLREIEVVIANVEALGVKWPVTVVPLMVHNVQQHSGVIFQITCELRRRRKRGDQDVIAAGGRYDKMLMAFRKVLERTGMTSKETKQYGVGISISLDKLVCAFDEGCDSVYVENKFGIDVAVPFYEGTAKREKEMANVLRELWSLGMKVITLDMNTVEEILEYCRENTINHIVFLRNGEKGTVRIQTWERDRFQERKVNIQDVADYLQRQTENFIPILNRSESKTNTNDVSTYTSNNSININVNFVLSERDKLSGSARRNLKNTMLAQMSSYLQRIAPKVPVEVFAVFLEMPVIRTITGFLEIDEDEPEFQKSVQFIIDKHQRHKKYIKDICDEMREVRNEKSSPILILFSLFDNRYMIFV